MRNIESWQIDKLHIKILSAGPRQLGSVRHLRSGVRWLPQQSVGQITGGGDKGERERVGKTDRNTRSG